ncbi:hypothetical protein WN943_010935 [Citrus x changshan-huyou]
MDGDGGPSSRHVCHDNELLDAEDDCYVFSKIEDDIDGGTCTKHETQYNRDDRDAHDDLLDRYKSDDGDYRAMSDFKTEHLFSRMSYALGGEMFVDGAKLVEFRFGQVLKKISIFCIDSEGLLYTIRFKRSGPYTAYTHVKVL